VVDMGDNAEVSNVFHGTVLAENGVKQQEATDACFQWHRVAHQNAVPRSAPVDPAKQIAMCRREFTPATSIGTSILHQILKMHIAIQRRGSCPQVEMGRSFAASVAPTFRHVQVGKPVGGEWSFFNLDHPSASRTTHPTKNDKN